MGVTRWLAVYVICSTGVHTYHMYMDMDIIPLHNIMGLSRWPGKLSHCWPSSPPPPPAQRLMPATDPAPIILEPITGVSESEKGMMLFGRPSDFHVALLCFALLCLVLSFAQPQPSQPAAPDTTSHHRHIRIDRCVQVARNVCLQGRLKSPLSAHMALVMQQAVCGRVICPRVLDRRRNVLAQRRRGIEND